MEAEVKAQIQSAAHSTGRDAKEMEKAQAKLDARIEVLSQVSERHERSISGMESRVAASAKSLIAGAKAELERGTLAALRRDVSLLRGEHTKLLSPSSARYTNILL